MIIDFFIISIMAGCWGYAWTLFISPHIPERLPTWIAKPIGACVVCTCLWWNMIVFLPIYLVVTGATWYWYLFAFICGGTSSAVGVIMNSIAQRIQKEREETEHLKQQNINTHSGHSSMGLKPKTN